MADRATWTVQDQLSYDRPCSKKEGGIKGTQNSRQKRRKCLLSHLPGSAPYSKGVCVTLFIRHWRESGVLGQRGQGLSELTLIFFLF